MTIKIVICLLSIATIINLFFAIKTKHPFKVMGFSGGLGIIAAIIFAITQYFFGIGIKLNLYTLLSSFIFGVPGIITMLITNVIWGI